MCLLVVTYNIQEFLKAINSTYIQAQHILKRTSAQPNCKTYNLHQHRWNWVGKITERIHSLTNCDKNDKISNHILIARLLPELRKELL